MLNQLCVPNDTKTIYLVSEFALDKIIKIIQKIFISHFKNVDY